MHLKYTMIIYHYGMPYIVWSEQGLNVRKRLLVFRLFTLT